MWIPTDDRVLLYFDEVVERVSEGGVVLPGTDVESRHREADVAAVGPNVREVRVTDRVLISSYAGTSMPGDELARVVRESDVLAVIA